MESALIKKLVYKGTLTALTGLRIGASKEGADIGGVDLPIVRHVVTKEPYIPGSSIKGKMRCLLEQVRGVAKVGDSPEVNNLFGITGNKTMSSRLIVRDAVLSESSKKELEDADTDFPFTEIKTENHIDRVKGNSDNFWFVERVPAGAKFNVEFVINVFENEDNLGLFEEGLKLLQLDYLGGHGSRGSGQVSIELEKPEVHDLLKNLDSESL